MNHTKKVWKGMFVTKLYDNRRYEERRIPDGAKTLPAMGNLIYTALFYRMKDEKEVSMALAREEVVSPMVRDFLRKCIRWYICAESLSNEMKDFKLTIGQPLYDALKAPPKKN
jgi:hypothetical protein